MKCTFIRGLSGSGKSTYAKTLGIPIINRDTLRLEYPEYKETEIELLEKQLMEQYAKENQDCVCDNTHMSNKSLLYKINFAKSLGYKTDVIDMYDIICKGKTNISSSALIYLNKCLEQNLMRDVVVPECVIYEMFLANYIDAINKRVIICDIDGTVANLGHRLHFIQGEKKDHEGFYANVGLDTPIQPVIDVINSLSKSHTIIFVSGRRNQTYRDTKSWLHKYGVQYDYLLMRGSWDRRPDTEVKEGIYNRCLKDLNIVGVFDDRPSVCEKRRELGLFVFNCQQGYKEF